MKVVTSDGQTFSVPQPDVDAIFVDVQIGDRSGFSKPIRFLFDTGAYGAAAVYLPEALLAENEMDLPFVKESQSELSDGSTRHDEYIALANIRFACIPSGSPVVFEGIRVIVSRDAASDPVINLGAFCDAHIAQGKLLFLDFSSKTARRLK